MSELWQDEAGFILSAELVMVATTVILGMTVALVAVRDAIGGELSDLAGAFRSLDQSYAKSGIRGCRKADGTYTSWTAGSFYLDPHLRTTGPEDLEFPGMIDVGGCPTVEKVVAPARSVCPTTPILPAAPLTAPELICPMEPEITLAPAPELPVESCVPCLSCLPGTNGLLAPTPVSVFPSCSAPSTIQSAPFSPVYHPRAAVPLGPLQVW